MPPSAIGLSSRRIDVCDCWAPRARTLPLRIQVPEVRRSRSSTAGGRRAFLQHTGLRVYEAGSRNASGQTLDNLTRLWLTESGAPFDLVAALGAQDRKIYVARSRKLIIVRTGLTWPPADRSFNRDEGIAEGRYSKLFGEPKVTLAAWFGSIVRPSRNPMMTESSSRALDATRADAEAQDAFGERVRRYQDAAFASAYAILKDRTAAEDATQAAFLTAWLRRNDLREPLAFGSWLRTIVRTECFRIIRRGRVTTVPLDEMPPPSAAPAPDPVHAAELRTVLLDAIATLSEADRTVIGLRYMSDSSYQEISDFLGLPVSTVKKRLHDARKRLLAWFTSQTAGALARAMLRDFRPSRDSRLEARVMNLTAFLDKVVRGDVTAVSAALDAQPALRDRKGEGKPLWSGSANALTVAAMSGRTDMVKLLIRRGAQLEPDNAIDVSPLVSAAVEGRSDVVRVLLAAGASVDIFAACALGDGARTSVLLAADPGVARARTSDGKTPLHFCRSVDVARRLLDAGARPDLDAVDDAGVTPLGWIGATGRYKDVCQFLIAQGATARILGYLRRLCARRPRRSHQAA